MSYRSILLACFASIAVLSVACDGGSNGTGTAGSSGGSSAGSGGGTAGSGGGTAGTGGGTAGTGGDTAGTGGGTAGTGGGTAGTGGGTAGTGGSTAGTGGGTAGTGGGTAGSGGNAGRGGGGGSTGNAGRGGNGGGGGSAGAAGGTGGGSFMLTSPDLADGAKFGKMFTCDMNNGSFGSGLLPELHWSGAPAGTMSFAITFIDTTIGENSSMGQHWAIWNIPATVTMMAQGTKTLTGELSTAKQNAAYLAPCAQSLVNNMDDNYEFTIYALSSATLNVSGMSVANALTALHAVTPLGTAKLHGHAGLKGK
jgi:phosphatidylethanolamine-binding protein (PEBP) family uncharacterized protein